jgi:hypothetical protein
MMLRFSPQPDSPHSQIFRKAGQKKAEPNRVLRLAPAVAMYRATTAELHRGHPCRSAHTPNPPPKVATCRRNQHERMSRVFTSYQDCKDTSSRREAGPWQSSNSGGEFVGFGSSFALVDTTPRHHTQLRTPTLDNRDWGKT